MAGPPAAVLRLAPPPRVAVPPPGLQRPVAARTAPLVNLQSGLLRGPLLVAVVAVGHRPAVLPGRRAAAAALPGAVVVAALPGAAVGRTGGVAVEEEVEVAVEARRMSQSLLIK